MPLPDRKRTRLAPPTRALVASAAWLAARATWRTLHPAARGHFVECQRPRPLERLYYRTEDGWTAPLLLVPPCPGGRGEPVVLSHALGLSQDGFRYGSGPTLASTLARAGFSVYLLAHRGDREALPPGRRAEVSFDHMVEQDVPAALERVLSHSGAQRALWVGHGLGGQLGLAAAARLGGHDIAGVVALGAAVRFERPRSEARRAATLARMLPAHWSLPSRTLARLAAPFVEGEEPVAPLSTQAPTPRLRGLLEYASADLPLGLLQQLTTWLEHGSMVDARGLLDYGEALVDARCPLLVLSGEGDAIAPPAAAEAALQTWGHPDITAFRLPDSFGHLDALLAADAPKASFAPVARWLEARRDGCWEATLTRQACGDRLAS